MWKRLLLAVLIATLAVAPALARSPIHEILAKGSEWELNVDGRSGVLRVLGGQASPVQGGGWAVTLEVDWDGRPGTLEGRSFGDEMVQAVTLDLTAPDQAKLTARGYIARESGDFMAGLSSYRTESRDVNGAWYATRRDAAPSAAGESRSGVPAPGAGAAGTPAAEPAAPLAAVETAAAPQHAAVRLCRVSGRITGQRELVGSVTAVEVESGARTASVRPHGDGGFEFEPLPDGRYRIAPAAAGPFELVVAPQERRIECAGSQDHSVEFQVLGRVGGR